jgi:trans-2,3-dihydro-3-hydroxyanthranilate isomerase
MSYRFHIADVFTGTAFGGNQLAVLPDARGLDDARMAAIAREFNFSETIFIFPPEDPANTRKVRIFTPGQELPFAGHPTVGAAHVLAVTGEIDLTGDETRIVLEEGVGPVPVVIRSRDGKPEFIQLTAAKIPERGQERFDPDMIASVVSLDSADLDIEGEYAIESYSAGLHYLFIPVRSLDAIGRARINMLAWEKGLRDSSAPEVFLFTRDADVAGRDAAFRGRMFAPTLGIIEDPATGSACASFGGYLGARASVRDGTLRYAVNQGVEMGRPSLLEVETDMVDGKAAAVRVGGTAVLVASGELHID